MGGRENIWFIERGPQTDLGNRQQGHGTGRSVGAFQGPKIYRWKWGLLVGDLKGPNGFGN